MRVFNDVQRARPLATTAAQNARRALHSQSAAVAAPMERRGAPCQVSTR
jgi:hypothetical protein